MNYKVLKPVGQFPVGSVVHGAHFPEGRAGDLVAKNVLEETSEDATVEAPTATHAPAAVQTVVKVDEAQMKQIRAKLDEAAKMLDEVSAERDDWKAKYEAADSLLSVATREELEAMMDRAKEAEAQESAGDDATGQPGAPADGLPRRTVAELTEIAKTEGVEVPEGATKPQIIEAIRAKRTSGE